MKAKKRRSTLRLALILPGVVILTLGLFYCYLVFRPTGYGEIEAQLGEATKAVEAATRSPISSDRIPQSHVERSGSPANPGPRAPIREKMEKDLKSCLYGNEILTHQVTVIEGEAVLTETEMIVGGSSVVFDRPGFQTDSLEMFLPVDASEGLQDCQGFAMSGDVRNTLIQRGGYNSRSQYDGRFLLLEEMVPAEEVGGEIVSASGEILTATNRFLIGLSSRLESLNPLEASYAPSIQTFLGTLRGINLVLSVISEKGLPFEEFNDMQMYSRLTPALHSSSWLLIAQALFKDDQEKASVLLERYLRAVRAIHMDQFPDRTAPNCLSALSVLFTLALTKEFPASELERAAAILNESRLSAEEKKKFVIADVARKKDTFMRCVATQEYAEDTVKQNVYHYFLNGSVERFVWRGMRPVVASQAEAFLSAWAKGDNAAIRKAEKELHDSHMLMNLRGTEIERGKTCFSGERPRALRGEFAPWGVDYYDEFTIANYHGEFFNDEVEFACVLVAALRYYRVHGKYPERVADLIPEYLDDSFRNTPESVWAIYTVEETSLPVFCRMDTGLREALRRWESENDKRPEHLEDLRIPTLFLEGRGGAAIRRQFERYLTNEQAQIPARPIICRFRPDKYHRWEFERCNELRLDQRYGTIKPEEKRELEEIEAGKAPAMVEVHIRVPTFLSMSEEVRKLLQDTDFGALDPQ